MDWLQTLLDNSSTPVWTAFLLGLLTALSPCPLATNIAAIGFIGKDIENRRRIFRNGALYAGTYSFVHVAWNGVDSDSERGLEHVWYTEDHRGVGRACVRTAFVRDRPFHAFR